MPKLWNDTIDEHRRAVRDAILDATATLVAKRGLARVNMSEIAAETGIGRATLYKYFGDVETILAAWHERQVRGHLEQLTGLRDRAGDARDRLEAVLEAYALMSLEHHTTELATILHRGEHVARAHQELHALVRELVSAGVREGLFRDDVAADELATYCLHALTAATRVPSKAAVRRLVKVILGALRPEEAF